MTVKLFSFIELGFLVFFGSRILDFRVVVFGGRRRILDVGVGFWLVGFIVGGFLFI